MTFKATVSTMLLGVIFVTNQAIAGSGNTHASLWNGQYMGFTLGASRGIADPMVHAKTTTYFTGTDPYQIDPEASHSMATTDISGNLFWGVNRQTDNTVYGVEIDLSLVDYDEQYSSGNITYLTLPTDSFSLTTNVKSDWSVSLRPRLGYAFKKGFFYISAGPVLRRFKYDFDFSDSPTWNQSTSVSKSKWKPGWIAGLGYEHKMQNDWSFRAEYFFSSYNDVIDTDSSLPGFPADGFTNKLDFTEQSLSIGLSKIF